MMRGMYAAISGLRTHQIMLDVTANDLSNVNTIGYKSARTTFKDSLAQLQRGAAGATTATGGSNSAQVGLGVQLGSIDNMMSSGALQATGAPLDVAIQGEGWFRIGAGDGVAVPTNISYTRAGNFTANDAGFLITQEGYYVIGKDAAGAAGADTYLVIPPGSSNVQIGQDGIVSYVDTAGVRQTAGWLSLAKFNNESGLERSSGNRWIAGTNAGPEQVQTPGNGYGLTIAGAVEMSNVDLATQFTQMITAQRGFQANSRVISTSDEMLADLVNMKR